MLAAWAADLAARPASPGQAGLMPPGTACIVTGQQPALGLGPLYTLVKTAHAVALAAAVSAAGRPCVAVHWVASEDHDRGEAGHADLIDRQGHRSRINTTFGGGRASLRFAPATAGWSDLMAHLGRVPGPGRPFLEAHAPQDRESLGEFQARLLKALFPGLITVEPHALRSSAAPLLRRVIADWPVDALRSSGWTQHFGDPATPPLFHDTPNGRTPLALADAAALLEAAPNEVSTGAGLRPLVQQVALPVLAYVGGPGEIAYHAALTPIFAGAGLPPPCLIPRISALLTPGWFLRSCKALGCDPRDPHAPHRPPAPDPALAALAQAVTALAERPDLRGHHQRLVHLQHRVARRLAPRHDGRSVGALQAWVQPTGAPQDRVLSSAQALWEWGPGLAQELVAAAGRVPSGTQALISGPG